MSNFDADELERIVAIAVSNFLNRLGQNSENSASARLTATQMRTLYSQVSIVYQWNFSANYCYYFLLFTDCKLENTFHPLNVKPENGTRPQQQSSATISLTTSTTQARLPSRFQPYSSTPFNSAPSASRQRITGSVGQRKTLSKDVVCIPREMETDGEERTRNFHYSDRDDSKNSKRQSRQSFLTCLHQNYSSLPHTMTSLR